MVGDLDCRGFANFNRRFVEMVESRAFDCGTINLDFIGFLWGDHRIHFDDVTGDPYTTREDVLEAVRIFTDITELI